MGSLFKILIESIYQVFSSLRSNKLRTFLSLLGIVIGIFCIVAVMSAVNSLENNVVSGFSELGSDVIYVQKSPWNDEGGTWWKYRKRPDPDYKDYKAIANKSKLAESVAYNIFTGGRTAKFNSNSVSNAFFMGSTFDYKNFKTTEIEKGRYFTKLEAERGTNKIILGATIVKALFGNIEPVGKEIRLFGQKFQVIATLKEEGENMFNILNFDEVMWMPLNSMRKYIDIENKNMVGELLAVKKRSDVEMKDVKAEITGIVRANRKLKPRAESNFAINEVSMIQEILGNVFGVINLAGFTIGIFALIVGMFSVANIMFVSVRERTSIIGVKKALGATQLLILFEFLIEAIALCLIGGLIGIFFVYIMLEAVSRIAEFPLSMTYNNAIIGLAASVIVGILSGLIPAYQASKLDPVVAIRM